MNILAQFWPYIAGAVGAIAAFLGVYVKGRSDARHKADMKAMRDGIKTRKRMDEVDLPATAHDSDAWLRKRADR